MRPLLALPLLLALAAAAPTSQPAPVANESRQIESFDGQGLLRVRDASSRDGTPMVLYPHEAWKCMTWKFEPVAAADKDTFRLVNHFTRKTCYPTDKADGTPVTQHPLAKPAADVEQWRFTKLDDGTYRIDHVASGKSLTLTDDHAMVIRPWTAAATQKWKLLPKPDPFTG